MFSLTFQGVDMDSGLMAGHVAIALAGAVLERPLMRRTALNDAREFGDADTALADALADFFDEDMPF